MLKQYTFLSKWRAMLSGALLIVGFHSNAQTSTYNGNVVTLTIGELQKFNIHFIDDRPVILSAYLGQSTGNGYPAFTIDEQNRRLQSFQNPAGSLAFPDYPPVMITNQEGTVTYFTLKSVNYFLDSGVVKQRKEAEKTFTESNRSCEDFESYEKKDTTLVQNAYRHKLLNKQLIPVAVPKSVYGSEYYIFWYAPDYSYPYKQYGGIHKEQAEVFKRNKAYETIAQANKISLKIQPNPASQFANATLTVQLDGNYHITITDENGNVMAQQGLAMSADLLQQTVHFKVSGWKAGLYNVTVFKGAERLHGETLLVKPDTY